MATLTFPFHNTRMNIGHTTLRLLLSILIVIPHIQGICYDVPGWVDSQGDGCDWYAEGENCRVWGTYIDFSNRNHTASTACCVCGGGENGNGYDIPSMSPTVTASPSEFFEVPIVTCSIGQVLAPSGACVDPVCEDIPWVDSMGNECETYEGRCETQGDDFFSNGHTANSACCICGGGVNKSNMLLQEASGKEWFENNKNNLILSASYPTIDKCVNFFNFTVVDLNYTCDDFVESGKSGLSCSRYGHFQDVFSGERAIDSCCVCGSDAGYRDHLLGDKFRVGFVSESDVIFTITKSTETGNVNGSLPMFMETVATQYGFGLYAQNISEESLALFDIDEYAACLYDLYMGYLDICVGNFPQDMGTALYSESLSVDEYFLVVPVYRQSFLEGLSTPFLPFTYSAWVVVIVAILYMTVIFSIITDDFDEDNPIERKDELCVKKCVKKYFSMSRCCHSLYSGLRSFTTLDVTDAPEEPTRAEKIVISGFVVFALVVITAYTATAATALYVAYQFDLYASLDDVLLDAEARICVHTTIRDSLLLSHPETNNQIVYDDDVSWLSSSDMIYDVGIGRGKGVCDVAFVTSLQFSNAAFEYHEVPLATSTDIYPNGRSFCDSVKLLSSDPIFEVQNSIAVSEVLGVNKSTALLDAINDMISYGYYIQLDKIFYDVFLSRQENYLNSLATTSTNEQTPSRNLKGGGGKATSRSGSGTVSSSSSGTNVCTNNNRLEANGLYQLEPFHLAMPISITVICSTVGLIVYILQSIYEKKKADRERAEFMKNRESIYEIFITKKIIDVEYDILHSEVAQMETTEIWDKLRNDGLREQIINQAINKLPDRGPLTKLYIYCKLSPFSKEYQLISTLEIPDLCLILSEMTPSNDTKSRSCKEVDRSNARDPITWVSIINSSEDPKTELIELIVNDPLARYIAITRIMCQEETDGFIAALLCNYSGVRNEEKAPYIESEKEKLLSISHDDYAARPTASNKKYGYQINDDNNP